MMTLKEWLEEKVFDEKSNIKGYQTSLESQDPEWNERHLEECILSCRSRQNAYELVIAKMIRMKDKKEPLE